MKVLLDCSGTIVFTSPSLESFEEFCDRAVTAETRS